VAKFVIPATILILHAYRFLDIGIPLAAIGSVMGVILMSLEYTRNRRS
jgi:hypothetical protein